MYAGQIVESAGRPQLFREPSHPYTRALMASMPALRHEGEALYTIPGLPPDMTRPIQGCAFAPRCEFAEDGCRQGTLQLREIRPGHATACIRVQAGTLPDGAVAAEAKP